MLLSKRFWTPLLTTLKFDVTFYTQWSDELSFTETRIVFGFYTVLEKTLTTQLRNQNCNDFFLIYSENLRGKMGKKPREENIPVSFFSSTINSWLIEAQVFTNQAPCLRKSKIKLSLLLIPFIYIIISFLHGMV